MAAPTESPIKLEYRGRLAIITIDNPKKLNALDQSGYYDLAQKLREVATHDEVFITLLIGKGRYFSAYVFTTPKHTPHLTHLITLIDLPSLTHNHLLLPPPTAAQTSPSRGPLQPSSPRAPPTPHRTASGCNPSSPSTSTSRRPSTRTPRSSWSGSTGQ